MTQDDLVRVVQGFDGRLQVVEQHTEELADVILGSRQGDLVRADDGLKGMVASIMSCLKTVKADLVELRELKKATSVGLWTFRAAVIAGLITAVVQLSIHMS